MRYLRIIYLFLHNLKDALHIEIKPFACIQKCECFEFLETKVLSAWIMLPDTISLALYYICISCIFVPHFPPQMAINQLWLKRKIIFVKKEIKRQLSGEVSPSHLRVNSTNVYTYIISIRQRKSQRPFPTLPTRRGKKQTIKRIKQK